MKVKEKGGVEAKKAAEQPSTDKGQSKKPAVGLVVRAARVEEMAIQPIDGGACRLETGKKKVKITLQQQVLHEISMINGYQMSMIARRSTLTRYSITVSKSIVAADLRI